MNKAIKFLAVRIKGFAYSLARRVNRFIFMVAFSLIRTFRTSAFRGIRILREPPASGTALALAPHVDDEGIGCGGTLALHSKLGDNIWILYLTTGELALNPDIPREMMRVARRAEAAEVGEVLSAKRVILWQYADRSLLSVAEPLEELAQIVRECHPAIVYVPYLVDIHPDHRVANGLLAMVLGAVQPDWDLLVGIYEVQSTLTHLALNTLVDVTPVLELKKSLIALYKSQIIPFDGILELNSLYAFLDSKSTGKSTYEAFRTMHWSEFVDWQARATRALALSGGDYVMRGSPISLIAAYWKNLVIARNLFGSGLSCRGRKSKAYSPECR